MSTTPTVQPRAATGVPGVRRGISLDPSWSTHPALRRRLIANLHPTGCDLRLRPVVAADRRLGHDVVVWKAAAVSVYAFDPDRHQLVGVRPAMAGWLAQVVAELGASVSEDDAGALCAVGLIRVRR